VWVGLGLCFVFGVFGGWLVEGERKEK